MPEQNDDQHDLKYRNWVSELDKREYLVIFECGLAVGGLEAVDALMER